MDCFVVATVQMQIRQKVAVTCTSTVNILQADDECYVAVIGGKICLWLGEGDGASSWSPVKAGRDWRVNRRHVGDPSGNSGSSSTSILSMMLKAFADNIFHLDEKSPSKTKTDTELSSTEGQQGKSVVGEKYFFRGSMNILLSESWYLGATGDGYAVWLADDGGKASK